MNCRIRAFTLVFLSSSLLISSGCSTNQGNSASSNSAARSSTNDGDIGEVLAEVNGMKIGTKAFDTAYNRLMPRRNPNKDMNDDEKKQMVIDRLIDDKVLYQEALRKGLDQDPKIQRMVVNTLLRQDVYSSLRSADISDEELQQYFEEHRDDFVIPEKVQLKRILIKADGDDDASKSKASGIRKQIVEKPALFKDIAIKESQDSYARRGGEVGFVSRAGKPGLDQAVIDAAFKLEPGTVSEVFKTDEGYNVVMVVNKRERVERSYEQMKGAVLRKLKTEKSRKIQKTYVQKLRAQAKIDIDTEKLKSYKPAVRAMPKKMPGMMRQMPKKPTAPKK